MSLIARIDAATGLVVNVECADLEWIEANADPDGPFLFVPYDETNPAHIGHGWDAIGGFVQPIVEDTFTLTADDLGKLGVEVAAVDQLVAAKEAAVDLEVAPTKGTK